jgi:hypothetical protein
VIRPFTFVCFMLACGSGLYLYAAKHRALLIDREIEKTFRATEELREQTRVLHAEWTLQNDPQRLQALADQFLSLKTVAPGQFTSMSDLDNRLPSVPAPEPPAAEPSEDASVPVAQAPPVDEPSTAKAPAALAPAPASAPPVKPAPVAVAAAPTQRQPERPQERPADHRASPGAAPTHAVLAEVQPVRPLPVVAHAAAAAERPRLPVAMPVTGSALGMARAASVPPPRPMPINASQWTTSGGGG